MASAEQRATKRSRTEDSHPETQIPTRGEPWLDDGNVILQAGSRQFRVHRSVLSASSPIFKDMFTLSSPADDALVEGCPVVHLSDTADDLHHVLKALYDREYYSVEKTPKPFSVIAAYLRLGRKYGIDQLHSEAMTRLSYEFPSSLEAFDSGPQGYELIGTDGTDSQTLLIAIIQLARENDVLSILPAALYICCVIAPQTIIEGVPQSDGSNYKLFPEDQAACLLGWHILLQKQADETLRWLDSEEILKSVCVGKRCMEERKQIIVDKWYPRPDCEALAFWDPDWDDAFCKGCCEKSKQLHNAGRQKVWNDLPSVFGLPGWEEISVV